MRQSKRRAVQLLLSFVVVAVGLFGLLLWYAPEPAEAAPNQQVLTADLRIVSVVQPSPEVQAGDQFTYTLLVDNLGPDTATNVVITDTLITSGFVDPNGCSIAVRTAGGLSDEFNCFFSLATGVFDLGTFGSNWLHPRSPLDMGRIIVTINATAKQGMTLTSVATASSETYDPDQSNNISTTFLTVESVSDIDVATTCTAASVVAGNTISCSTTLNNKGPSIADGTTVEMAVPAEFEVVSISGTTGGCVAGTPGNPSDPATCSFGHVAPANAQTMDIVLKARSDAVTDVVTDQKVVQIGAIGYSDMIDTDFVDNYSHTSLTIEAQADLALAKFAVGTPRAGAALSFEYDISNLGPSVSRDVSLRDFLPDEVEFIDAYADYEGSAGATPLACAIVEGTNVLICPLGDIAPTDGVPVFVFVNVQIKSDVPGGTLVNNNADVNLTDTPDPNPENNSDSAEFTVFSIADVSIEKSSEPSKVNAGEQKKYSVSVTNHGPSDAQQVTVYDVLPDEVVYEVDTSANACSQPANLHGFSANLSGANEVPPISTTASGLASFVLNSDTNQLYYSINVADIEDITASHIHAGVAGVNGGVEITLYSGATPFDATQPLVGVETLTPVQTAALLADPGAYYVNVHTTYFPAGEIRDQLSATVNTPVKCEIGTMKPGETQQFDIFVEVQPDTPLDTTITNVAMVNSETTLGDAVMSNNVATSSNLVLAKADLRVLKFASPSPSLTVGDPFTYTIVVDNLGPSAASNVIVTDTLISSDMVMPTACNIEIQTANGTSTVAECNTGAASGVFDLATMGVSLLNPRSPDDPGRAVITINGVAEKATVLENLTTVTSDAVDPDNSNNYATTTLSIETAVADLSVQIFGAPDGFVDTGEQLQLLIVVDNLGPNAASDVEVAQEIIGNALFDIVAINPDVLGNQPGASCLPVAPVNDVQQQTLTCTLGGPMDMLTTAAASSLVAAAGESTEVLAAATGTSRWVIEVIVQADSPVIFTGLVSATSAENDPFTGNNLANLQNSVACDTTGFADLSLVKGVQNGGSITPGSNILYTLDYSNNSTSDAYCVSVSEEVPMYTTFDSATSDAGWSCLDNAPAGSVCLYELGTVESGAQGTLNFGVTVDGSLQSGVTITNTATIQSGTKEVSPSNNSGVISVEVTVPTSLGNAEQPKVELFLPAIEN